MQIAGVFFALELILRIWTATARRCNNRGGSETEPRRTARCPQIISTRGAPKEAAMLCAHTIRRLKPGTFDQFVKTFGPPKDAEPVYEIAVSRTVDPAAA